MGNTPSTHVDLVILRTEGPEHGLKVGAASGQDGCVGGDLKPIQHQRDVAELAA